MKYILGCGLAFMISYSRNNESWTLFLHTLLSWFYVLVQILVKMEIIL